MQKPVGVPDLGDSSFLVGFSLSLFMRLVVVQVHAASLGFATFFILTNGLELIYWTTLICTQLDTVK